MIKWGLEFKVLSVDDEWAGVINALSKMWESPINDIEQYMIKYKDGIREMRLHLGKCTDETVSERIFDLSLVLTEPNLEEYKSEIDKLCEKLGIINMEDY